jgi:4'-phosphopantetheinyl transferase
MQWSTEPQRREENRAVTDRGSGGGHVLLGWARGVALAAADPRLMDLAGEDALLGLSDRVRYETLVGPRREQFVAGRALLRRAVRLLLPETEGAKFSALCEACGGAHGTPRVIGADAPRIVLSLSHTEGLTIAAATDRYEALGVDVEAADVGPSGTAHRGLSLLREPAATLADWARVEAVLKADGRGLLVDPAAVRIAEDDAGTFAKIADGAARYRLISPDAGTGLAGLLANGAFELGVAVR